MDLNFGQRTGIDLPSEKRPQWPDPNYLDGKYGKGKWVAVGGPGTFESLNLAIGQATYAFAPAAFGLIREFALEPELCAC